MVGLLFADEVESSEEYRFATEEEKQQLFDALEKEGKAWDAEKKQIVDLKPKVELKPFDNVLVRHQKLRNGVQIYLAIQIRQMNILTMYVLMVDGSSASLTKATNHC